ncbi:MAG: outer membrane lipoprotein carrier protein LolA [Akkermansiaceae bacterium]|jgi:outer membrane lipoprotein carrier protein|nr:outer membrane lipoprotein carrier protein LolA [Akkermansiaceae bacterium]
MRFLALLLLSTAFLRADVDTAPLEAWLKRQASVRSLEADFIQERTLPSLKKPVTTPGTLTIARPGKLRWDLGKPAKTIAVSDGTTITLFDVEKKQARRISADSSRAKSFSMLGDKSFSGGLEGFTQAFDLVESRMTDGIYQLTTRPKDRSMRGKVGYVFFDIDPAKSELRAIELRLDDKSRIRTIFTKTRFNTDIPADRFAPSTEGYEVR